MSNDDYKLKSSFVLWYHKINDTNWDKDSYISLGKIDSIKSFWIIYNKIGSFLGGMFFLMREGIFPQWEDKANIKGGYWSFKISTIVRVASET